MSFLGRLKQTPKNSLIWPNGRFLESGDTDETRVPFSLWGNLLRHRIEMTKRWRTWWREVLDQVKERDITSTWRPDETSKCIIDFNNQQRSSCPRLLPTKLRKAIEFSSFVSVQFSFVVPLQYSRLHGPQVLPFCPIHRHKLTQAFSSKAPIGSLPPPLLPVESSSP